EAGPTAVEPPRVVLLDPVARHVARPGDGRTAARVDDPAAAGVDEARARVLEEREVGPEPELVAAAVELRRELVLRREPVPILEVDVLAIGAATLGRVDRAEAVEPAGGHLAQRQLPRAVPVTLVGGRLYRELGGLRRVEGELHQAVVLGEVLLVLEGTVRVERLRGDERLHPADPRRRPDDVTLRIERAAL